VLPPPHHEGPRHWGADATTIHALGELSVLNKYDDVYNMTFTLDRRRKDGVYYATPQVATLANRVRNGTNVAPNADRAQQLSRGIHSALTQRLAHVPVNEDVTAITLIGSIKFNTGTPAYAFQSTANVSHTLDHSANTTSGKWMRYTE